MKRLKYAKTKPQAPTTAKIQAEFIQLENTDEFLQPARIIAAVVQSVLDEGKICTAVELCQAPLGAF